MAGRKGGLGKGLDGLFPIYNTEEIKEKNPGKEDVSYEKTSAPGKKRTVAAGKMKTVPSKEKENKDRETDIPSAQEEAAQENGVVTVRLSKVEPNRDQPRQTFDEESLNELAQSISQYGILQPLVVQKKEDRYEIVAGKEDGVQPDLPD